MQINFYDRFIKLCDLNNIKPTPALQALGLSTGCMQKWKSGAAVTVTTLEKVANYFDVPPEYFLSDEAHLALYSKAALDKLILDEIAAVQTLAEQCAQTLNRLENLYKQLNAAH